MVKKGKEVKVNHSVKSGKQGWELALTEAKTKLYQNLGQRRRLYAAIRLFEEKIRNGDPWPRPARE
jgi:hypothetical protein